MIWGISTYNSIGDDAKVTILATGMKYGYQDIEEDQKDDDYYERLISQLYKPAKKALEGPVEDTDITINIAPDPAPRYVEPEEPETVEAPQMPLTIAEKIKNWLANFLKEADE